MWKPVIAVSVGASVGALLRWWLSAKFNGAFPTMPPGTLIANLVGGYVVGVAIGYFAVYPALSPEWRLLIITGFCGGLTTFSTFSAEIAALLQGGQVWWAVGTIAAHLFGSVAMTLAGLTTVAWVRG
jgi:fluoride exporter